MVKVAQAGEREVTTRVRDDNTGQDVDKVVSNGEQYRVCCPYCGDKRYRLYIGYLWNTLDSQNRRQRSRIFCQNENCSMKYFEEELRGYMQEVRIDVNVVGKRTQALGLIALPGACVSLRDLPINHPGVEYVKSRKFDPYELADVWGISYCVTAPEDDRGFVPGTGAYAKLVRDRLIIPIYWGGKLAGWQARSLEPRPSVKYYTCPGMNKSMLLYNGDRAKQFSFGVVVEGVTDCWRVGERGVALLGKTLSQYQLQMLYNFWSRGGCCLMLDPDAHERDKQHPDRPSAVEIALSKINAKGFKEGFFDVCPPQGEDPGSMTNVNIWALITGYARARGIKILSA